MDQNQKIQKALESDGNVCMNCFSIVSAKEGGLSKCCGEVVLSSINLSRVVSGKIPKITADVAIKPQRLNRKPRKEARDAVTGLRKGTIKYKAYQLWRAGKKWRDAAKKLEANESSVRSWFGTFNKKFAR